MPIPEQFALTGDNKEFQFRDRWVMPLLLRLGFGVVVNYHGTREFGRDVIFGEVDRFGHVVYYGMQVKYEASISQSTAHGLIQDAEEAWNHPFVHPQTGRQEYISRFFVVNAGSFAENARENFFNVTRARGIRDARLIDGNGLLVLDRAASLNRNADMSERLAGLLQEVRVNGNLFERWALGLQSFVNDPTSSAFPSLRFRNNACAMYLNAPFAIPGVPVDVVDQYWQMVQVLNKLADSMDGPVIVEGFQTNRFKGVAVIRPDFLKHSAIIESALVGLLAQVNGSGTSTVATPP